MTTFATTLGSATNTVTSTMRFANAIRSLLVWGADPRPLDVNPSGRPKSMLTRNRPLPVLTGGTDVLDFSDFEDD